MSKKGLTYKDAGVDIDSGNFLAQEYLHHIRSTLGPQVVRNDGGFAGLYRLRGTQGLFARKISDPLLVSATDGVGTKLKIAFALAQHDTVGIDLVAMSVNDILVQGAEPIIFLDYIATGKADKRIMGEIVKGIAEGCKQAGCALLGGETAEHPGDFRAGEYDLAGFAVGLVEAGKLVDGKRIVPGDVVLGLASNGLHANGFSLARKALLEVGRLKLEAEITELGCSLGTELLRPTTIYVQPVMSVLNAYKKKKPVKALAHITGGGLLENIPRILPSACNANIKLGSWPVPPVFPLIAKCGKVRQKELYRVFNMGIGMTMIVAESSGNVIREKLGNSGISCYQIGRVVKGNGKVKLCK